MFQEYRWILEEGHLNAGAFNGKPGDNARVEFSLEGVTKNSGLSFDYLIGQSSDLEVR